ncbi:transglutaminase family protein [Brevibacillus daliensis]|uniref:transglutaminase family protein n=1 Tax=Brevibacillus daliensis TaxID=2892995 RepID=UPI001E64C106|nr:transglutaminase domain-containing protein [Brevibacillus daliensis]
MGTSLWKRTQILQWMAAIFLFFLLREWLLPLPELSDTGDMTVFYLLIGTIILLDVTIRSKWIAFVVKLLVALFLFHSAFVAASFFDIEWLRETISIMIQDIPQAFSQNWDSMSIVSRNVLFFLVIVVVVSLLNYLVLGQRQGLWFVFLTITYLAVLDTFMPFDASESMMRSIVIGFMLIATLHLSTVYERPHAQVKISSLWKSLFIPMVIVTLAIGVGYSAPKAKPAWPDPVSFFQGKNGNGSGTGMKKVGYDTNDRMLGGPFQQDDTLVFTVTTNDKFYLRGDSKNIYTGKGWTKSEKSVEAINHPFSYEWGNTLYFGMETKKVQAVIQAEDEQYPALFYPGQMKSIEEMQPAQATLTFDSKSQGIITHNGSIERELEPKNHFTSSDDNNLVPGPNGIQMSHYQLQLEVPVISEKRMIEAGTNYPQEIRDEYLQIPPTLPNRVRELAKQITANATNPYDKARAIENYLRSQGRYQYETTDVPMPKEGQDFVDHFLFDSMRGYCDHFSTAMVVMLRSEGIPARWVKGFAPGKEIKRNGEQVALEVRNRDAHSWVEVYIPNNGWIPFEATASFSSPLRVNYDRYSADNEQNTTPDQQEEDKQSTTPDKKDRLLEDDEQIAGIGGTFGSWNWNCLWPIVIVAALAGLFFWKKRNEVYVWWLARKVERYSKEEFPNRYSLLITIFEKAVSPREPGETLREYVKRLRITGDKKQDLLYATTMYEKMLYGYKDMEEKVKTLLHQTIERLIRQMKP